MSEPQDDPDQTPRAAQQEPAASSETPEAASSSHRQPVAAASRQEPAASSETPEASSHRQPAASSETPEAASSSAHQEPAAAASHRQPVAAASHQEPAAASSSGQTPAAADGKGAAAAASGTKGPATRSGRHKARSKGLGLLRETAIIVVSALVLSWLIKTLLVQAFYIPSQSMEDTLEKGDRVMVSRLVPRVLDISRGDIVVFKDPGGWLEPYVPRDYGSFGNLVARGLTMVGLLPQDTGEHLIKRVIGLPGDTVTCCTADGLVTVNGAPIHEDSYLKPGVAPSERPFDVVVPEGMLFVMGDNRSSSSDSRYNTAKPGGGFVPVDNVIGTAFATVWPFDRATWHRNPGSVFEGVPEP